MFGRRFIDSNSSYISKVRQQEEIPFNYDKKQALTTKKHADRNKRIADKLFELAEKAVEPNEQNDYYSGAASNYIKATEKYEKFVLHAIGDDKVEVTQNGKTVKLISSHSTNLINNHLEKKNKNLISGEDAKFIEQAHRGKGLSYIAAEYGDVNGEVVSFSFDDTKKLKEITTTASEKSEDEIRKEKKRRNDKEIENIVNNVLKHSSSYSK